MIGETEASSFYRAKVIEGVLNAMITAGAIEGSEQAAVDLFAALEGACDAMAALVDNTEAADTPDKREEIADLCRTRFLETLTELVRRAEQGQSIRWGAEEIGRTN